MATSSERASGAIPTPPPAPFLHELLSSRRSNVAQSITSSDGGASDIGRLAIKSDAYEDEEEDSSRPASVVSPSTRPSELPSSPPSFAPAAIASSTAAFRGEEEPKQPLQPTRENVLRTSAGEEAREAVSASQRSHHSKSDSTESGVIDPEGPLDQKARNGSGSTGSDGTLTASNSTATVAASAGEDSMAASGAQKKAREAIMVARSKSQRVKRPPVGRPMTAAEMDASDDDYEPGGCMDGSEVVCVTPTHAVPVPPFCRLGQCHFLEQNLRDNGKGPRALFVSSSTLPVDPDMRPTYPPCPHPAAAPLFCPRVLSTIRLCTCHAPCQWTHHPVCLTSSHVYRREIRTPLPPLRQCRRRVSSTREEGVQRR